MKKITTTQRSTGRQLDYMAANLEERHNADVSVQRFVSVLKGGEILLSKYWIHVHGVAFGFKDTWEEAQAYYRELMKLK